MNNVKFTNVQRNILISTQFLLFLFVSTSIASAKERGALVFGAGITRNREANVFYQGEPIYIGVSLQRTDSMYLKPEETLQIGTSNNPWYKDVKIIVNKFNERNKSDDVNIILFSGSSKNELVKINEADSASWIIDPNSTSKLFGKYLIDISFSETNIKKSHPNIPIEYRGAKIEIDINEPKTDKQKAEVISHQGEYYSRQKKQNVAMKLFLQAMELDPTRQDLHCSLGSCYEASGDLDNTIKEYKIYVNWVRSLNIPRTGKDDINLHADIIEGNIKMLEQFRREK